MANWKVKCIGCADEVNLGCNNCGHEDLKGIKNSSGLWLHCNNCKQIMNKYTHWCSLKDGGTRITQTDLNRNRDHFYKLDKQYKGDRTRGISWLRFLLYLIIFVVIFYLIFPSLFQLTFL
tara:strand:- start:318 stop:677 length:360 start_codon:yes stop_codon:yes gene_type:complete